MSHHHYFPFIHYCRGRWLMDTVNFNKHNGIANKWLEVPNVVTIIVRSLAWVLGWVCGVAGASELNRNALCDREGCWTRVHMRFLCRDSRNDLRTALSRDMFSWCNQCLCSYHTIRNCRNSPGNFSGQMMFTIFSISHFGSFHLPCRLSN